MPSYTLTFTLTDSYSTGTNELTWQIRTAASGGGSLLATGSATSGVQVTTGTINDTGLAHGSNSRWLRVIDGAGNVLDHEFTVTAQLIFDKEQDGDAEIDATGTVTTTATIPAAGDAEIDATGDVSIGVELSGDAAVGVTGNATVEVIEFKDAAGDAAIDITGDVSLETEFESEAGIDLTGDASVTAALDAFGDAAIDVAGDASIGVTPDGTVAVEATGTTIIGPVLDADAAIDATGDVSIDADIPPSGDAAIDATGDVALVADTPLSGDAAIQATGNLDIELVGFEIRGHRLRAEFYDASGDPIGAGPVLDIISASYSLTLNEIGTWKLVIPATLPIAGQIIAGSRLKLYREGEGLIYQGIVHTPRIVVPETGEYTLEIVGDSVARELVWHNTLFGLEFSNEAIDDVVDDLVSGTGWTADTETDARNLTIQYNAASIWRATVHAAEMFGWHVRENNLDRTIDVGPMGDPSGLVLQNVTHIEDEMGVVPIRSLALASEQADLWNRVVPVGGGDGINVLTLRYSNRTSPYTIQSDTGPDGQTYWYIEDATSIAAHGERTMPLSFPDVVPLSNSDAEIRNAANALYDIAAAWLGWHATAYETYEVEIGGIRHYDDNGDPLIQVGDTVRLVYRGLAVDESGETYVWKDIDTNVYVIALERAFSPGDLNAWRLTVSTSSQQAPGDAEAMAQAIDDLWAVQTSKRPYTYREIHGPYVESVNGSNSATFLVDFDSNVTYLHSATLRVRKRRVKSNVTGSAAGGGQTSGDGGAHSHTINATSTPSGGGHTSLAGSTHTHTVTGGTALGGGVHTHGVAAMSASVPPWNDPLYIQQMTFFNSTHGEYGVYVGRQSNSPTISTIRTDETESHTHTLSGITAVGEGSHTHGVQNHSHAISAHATQAVTNHQHTIQDHTHAPIYGIYLGPTATTPQIHLEINGVDVTDDLGGPWNTDFVADITPYLVDSNGHVLRQANNLEFSASQLCDLEVVVRSMVTAHSVVPV